ncbi:MAG TPA: DUF1566 domain-containing protein [Myxococcales bacterium]|jgi:hypothetical protein
MRRLWALAILLSAAACNPPVTDPPDTGTSVDPSDAATLPGADAAVVTVPDSGLPASADAAVASPDAGPATGHVRLSVATVEHCPVESPIPPGMSATTATGARAGIVAIELLRKRDDLAPAALPLGQPRLDVDLVAGGPLAQGDVPAGTYTHLRYELAWGSLTVPIVAHQAGMNLAGTAEFDVATESHVAADGRNRVPGELVVRVQVAGTSNTQFASVQLDCPLSSAGGVVDTGTGKHFVTVPMPKGPLTVAAGASLDVLAQFPLASTVAWIELTGTGFAAGKLDLASTASGSEKPARLPVCELLLSDRCEAGAKPLRTSPAWPIPDSATTACTDGKVAAACPQPGAPFYGQDGNTTLNPPHYTTTADTVRDEVTGLLWQRHSPPDSYDWWGSLAYCEGLVLAGRDDWSLPSRVELTTILDVGRFNPTFDPAVFADEPADFYWSASPAMFSSLAFGVRFDQGFVYDHDPKVSGRVRCVADGKYPAAPRWDIQADTALDRPTGITWQRITHPAATWQEALATCDALDLGGASDWRLPTLKELLAVVEDTALSPCIDVAALPDTPAQWLWASTPGLGPTDYAQTVSFTDGYCTPAAVTERFVYKCVR